MNKQVKTEHKQARQGDVLFDRVNDLPEGLKKKDDTILAYGEESGHIHQVFGEKTEVYEDDNGQMYIAIPKGGSSVEHVLQGTRNKADHDGLDFPGKTFWKVTIQNQFNPYQKKIEQVRD